MGHSRPAQTPRRIELRSNAASTRRSSATSECCRSRPMRSFDRRISNQLPDSTVKAQRGRSHRTYRSFGRRDLDGERRSAVSGAPRHIRVRRVPSRDSAGQCRSPIDASTGEAHCFHAQRARVEARSRDLRGLGQVSVSSMACRLSPVSEQAVRSLARRARCSQTDVAVPSTSLAQFAQSAAGRPVVRKVIGRKAGSYAWRFRASWTIRGAWRGARRGARRSQFGRHSAPVHARS